jgi:hypothetical protein
MISGERVLFVLLILVELLTITELHQYQQNVVLPLNSDGQQLHQYQQNVVLPLNSDGQQLHQYQQNVVLPQYYMLLILV